jgi:prolyl-tRNA synthetase
VREFIMKDAYSFDRDEAGLDEAFRKHAEAYGRIFERCGLEFYEVEAESGMMGGSGSHDYLAPTGSGENYLVRCENSDYAADIEIAAGRPSEPDFPEALAAPEEVETPGMRTIDDVSKFLELDPRATAKAMPVAVDGKVVLTLIRGDDRLNEAKLLAAFGPSVRPAEAEEIERAFGAGPGSIGPVGATVEVVADEALREGQYVVAPHRPPPPRRGAAPARDYEPRFADLREVREGDRCPKCGGKLRIETAIEVGHIFKLGTTYSAPLGATFLDEDGTEKPLIMGSYGIGPGRVMAAIVEQHHDDQGIVWPRAVAPYDVHVVALPGVEEQSHEAAEALDRAGLAVLLDDREARAGEKFADADLLGLPTRITVGKKTLEDGAVDVRDRATGDEKRIPIEALEEAF